MRPVQPQPGDRALIRSMHLSPRTGLRLRRAAGALAAIALVASPAAAQEEPSTARHIRGFLDVGTGVTGLHGDATALVGGAAGLRVGDSWAFGGAGYVLPSAVTLGRIDLQDVEMLLGYAGILVEWRSDEAAPWFVRGVVGAGNVDVRDAATGTQLDSDNVLVVAPSVGFALGLGGRWSAMPMAGYRIVTGAQDLRGVDGGDLRGFTLGVALRLSPL